MNRSMKATFVGLSALVVAVGFFFWWTELRPFIKIENASIITPQQRLAAKKSGLIARLSSHPGKRIARGEELAVLFHEDVQLGITQIEAEIEKQKQTLISLKKDLDEGMKKYIEANSQGSEFLEPALMAIQQAQMESETVDAKIEVLEKEKKSLTSQIETKILAPSDCIILQQFKREGDSISQGEEILAISRPSSFVVEAEIPVHMLQKIQAGLPAIVSFPSFSRQKWAGQVTAVGPEVVNGMVRIQVVGNDLPLYPGLTGEIQIRTK